MNKIQTFLKKTIQILFIICVGFMILYNLLALTDGFSIVIVSMAAVIIIAGVLFLLYRKKIINKRFLVIVVAIILLIGVGYRIYLIQTTDFELSSDFKLYYDTAKIDANNSAEIADNSYLTYNSYVVNYAKVLSPLIRIFGDSPTVPMYFNLIMQLLTVFLIYKCLRIKMNKVVSFLGSTVWFMMPSVIFSTLLISTESLFMPLFMTAIYLMLKLLASKFSTGKECLLYAVLGIACSLTNAIRPVMAVFIIAFVIIYILSITNFKKVLPFMACLLAYVVMNKLILMYDTHELKEIRSGALGWSIYFGSNYEANGSWNENDASEVFTILQKTDEADKEFVKLSLDRYKNYGIRNTLDLFNTKFYQLWTDNNGIYPFLPSVVTQDEWKNKFEDNSKMTSLMGTVIVMFVLVGSLATSIKEFKKKKYTSLFLQLFIIGYVLSNLLVVYNSRYNFPAYPLFIIMAFQCLSALEIKQNINKKELHKIDNAKVLAIIPAYNESKNIQNVSDSLENTQIANFDYLVINDGSTDNTEKICIENDIPHITLTQNLGIGGSVQTGYKYAYENGYDIAIQFDGDGQHDANYIKDIIKPVVQGKADFVIGSRFIGDLSEFKSSFMRQFGSKILSSIMQMCTSVKITDPTSGFRAVNRDVMKDFVQHYPVDYPEPETIVSAINKGFTVKEVPVKMNERKQGKSSITPFKSAYYMISVSIAIILTNYKKGEK